MLSKRILFAVLLCFGLLVTISGQTSTDQKSHQHGGPKSASIAAVESTAKRSGVVSVGTLRVEIPDLLIHDQDGRQRRFYSDLIKDKVVIMSFFFTKCTSVCPAMRMALTRLQTNLGERLGKDVFIVTVTKDPETDTPEKLKEWERAVGAKPGWTMVTGEAKVIEKIVRDFTGDPLGQGMHNTVFILGNDRTGEWTDLHEFVSAKDLEEQVDRLSKTTP